MAVYVLAKFGVQHCYICAPPCLKHTQFYSVKGKHSLFFLVFLCNKSKGNFLRFKAD